MNTISCLGKDDGFQRIVGLILQVGGRKEKLKVFGIGSCWGFYLENIISGQQLLFVFLKQFLGSFFVPKVDRVIFFGLDSLFEQHLQFMFVLLEDG